jgi:arginine-tRNA-protein transferase
MNDAQQRSFTARPFYLTTAYPCQYLPGKIARSQVALPHELIHTQGYPLLIQQGFRRSGLTVYRPYCAECQACISVRIPTHDMQYNRSQRRILKKHRNLHSCLLPLQYSPAHFELYQRYQTARHSNDEVEQTSTAQYRAFILKSHINSFLVEFRDEHHLRMVSLIDQLEDGLSAVYTFFDPDVPSASYGVYSILWLVQYAKERDLPYLYLGYWIADCPKMAYKKHYQPLEGYIKGQWQRLTEPVVATSCASNEYE